MTTQLSDYADKYHSINFSRDEAGVLEMTMHTRGGPAGTTSSRAA